MTPAGKAKTGSTPCVFSQGETNHVAQITHTFNSTGVAAGTAKCFQVFKIPADKATIDMKPI
jgi:hypothetical protein